MTLIATLFALYAINPADLLNVCAALNACEFAAVYFMRGGCVYRAFLQIDEIPQSWYRFCVSSKNDADIRIKLYIPAAAQKALIENGAELINSVESFFADFQPMEGYNRGNYVESYEIRAAVHAAVNLCGLDSDPETSINIPSNTHLPVFDGGDYSISGANDCPVEISVKLQDATVYSLDSLALCYNKHAAAVEKACAAYGKDSAAAILQTVKQYAEKFHPRRAAR